MKKTIYKVGVIGKTGEGNYGHHLDTAFHGIHNAEIISIADHNEIGLKEAGIRTGAERLYLDYEEMLKCEDLDIVVIGPRWIDCHLEIALKASTSNILGILMEKPMAKTLSETDLIIDSCEKNRVRIAVAHRRANLYEKYAKKIISEGAIGQLMTIRGAGKSDHRSGPEDLVVLGTHILDSMRYFVGTDVSWAQSSITLKGQEITKKDLYEGGDQIGLIAGDRLDCFYMFKNGVTGHFESYRRNISDDRSPFGIDLYGTEGIIALRGSPNTEMYIYPNATFFPDQNKGKWERISIEDWEINLNTGVALTPEEKMKLSNNMIASELILAIEEERDVIDSSSGYDGRAALEMIMAVYESQRLHKRVDFPLQNRENPYLLFTD
tara:strand:- start:66544 stop:67683 length:1140 start_codon:yes stop_codon:yes gene_type:complete